MFHEGVAPALLLCVFHFPLNKLRRLFIRSTSRLPHDLPHDGQMKALRTVVVLVVVLLLPRYYQVLYE